MRKYSALARKRLLVQTTIIKVIALPFKAVSLEISSNREETLSFWKGRHNSILFEIY